MFFFGISPVFSTNPEVFMTILMGLDLLQNAASIFGSQCKHKDLYATSNTQFVVFFFPKDPVGSREDGKNTNTDNRRDAEALREGIVFSRLCVFAVKCIYYDAIRRTLLFGKNFAGNMRSNQ